MSDIDFLARLAGLPLDCTVEIDDERVYLNRYADGTELGIYLFELSAPSQLAELLQNGFPSALQFEAGVALNADGGALTLTQWLPNTQSWLDVSAPLEKILAQAAAWRSSCPRQTPPIRHDTRRLDDQRMRKMLGG